MHYPEKCLKSPFPEQCGNGITAFAFGEKRFVADVEALTKVTEHEAMKIRECMRGGPCGIKDEFPEGINARIRYGDNFAVLGSILSTYGDVSYVRVAAIIRSLTCASLSEGTPASMAAGCAGMVESPLGKINLTTTGTKETSGTSRPKPKWQAASEAKKAPKTV